MQQRKHKSASSSVFAQMPPALRDQAVRNSNGRKVRTIKGDAIRGVPALELVIFGKGWV